MRKLVFGFFMAAGSVQAEPVVIAALGDSLTQGYGLVQSDGLVPQLQSWLDAQGVDVKLINAGVSGDTTAGGLSRVDWTLTPDVDAMIVALGGNDLLRGLPAEQARSNLEGILKVAHAKDVDVLLIGFTPPKNYGVQYFETFSAIYPDLAEAYGTVYMEYFFSGFGKVEDLSAYRDLMQPDMLHPNADGVAKIVEGVGPKVMELIEATETGS